MTPKERADELYEIRNDIRHLLDRVQKIYEAACDEVIDEKRTENMRIRAALDAGSDPWEVDPSYDEMGQ